MTRSVRTVFSLLLLLVLSVSCVSQRNNEHTRQTAEQRIVRHRCDSIFIKDSIFVKERADTVFITRTHTLFRERLRTDTLFRVDTIISIKEVVKEVSKGNIFMYRILVIVMSIIIFYLCRRKLFSTTDRIFNHDNHV